MFVHVIVTLLLSAHGASIVVVPPGLLRSLWSSEQARRYDAYDYAMKFVRGSERGRVIPYLTLVVCTESARYRNNYVDPDVARFAPSTIALGILADWGDPRCIELFIKYVDYYSPNLQAVTSFDSLNNFYAAMRGIKTIGPKAIEPCIESLIHRRYFEIEHFKDQLKRESQKEIRCREANLLYVICDIAGAEAVGKMLREGFERARLNDAENQNRLGRYLRLIEKSK